jgi:hypothetical protein
MLKRTFGKSAAKPALLEKCSKTLDRTFHGTSSKFQQNLNPKGFDALFQKCGAGGKYINPIYRMNFFRNFTNYGPKSFKGKSVKDILSMSSGKVPADFFEPAYVEKNMKEFAAANLSDEQLNAIELLSDLKDKLGKVIPKCYKETGRAAKLPKAEQQPKEPAAEQKEQETAQQQKEPAAQQQQAQAAQQQQAPAAQQQAPAAQPQAPQAEDDDSDEEEGGPADNRDLVKGGGKRSGHKRSRGKRSGHKRTSKRSSTSKRKHKKRNGTRKHTGKTKTRRRHKAQPDASSAESTL